MPDMEGAHNRWRRQRRRHDRIEDAVDDVAWGAQNLNRSLQPRGCGVVALASLAGLMAAASAVGWRLL